MDHTQMFLAYLDSSRRDISNSGLGYSSPYKFSGINFPTIFTRVQSSCNQIHLVKYSCVGFSDLSKMPWFVRELSFRFLIFEEVGLACVHSIIKLLCAQVITSTKQQLLRNCQKNRRHKLCIFTHIMCVCTIVPT